MKTDNLKKAWKHASLVFFDSSSKKEDTQKAEEKFLFTLVGQSKSISVNEARVKFFIENIDGKQVVKQQCLPLTIHCACFHFYRVYYQVQECLGNLVLPHMWGWVESNGKYYPVFMTQPAAPYYLLQYVRCGYKADKCHKKHVLVKNIIR